MKIGIDCAWFSVKKAPGYNYYLYSLIDGIVKSDFLDLNDVEVFYPDGENAIVDRYYKTKIKFTPIDVGTLLKRFIWLFKAAKICNNLDVVLFTSGFCSPFGVFKKILVIHDFNYKIYPKNFNALQLWFRRVFVPVSMFSTDKIVCISSSVQSSVPKLFKYKSIVVHNAFIDQVGKVDAIKSDFLSELMGNLYGKTIILIPSSLAQHKNLQETLNAAINILNSNSNICFIFIGNWNSDLFVREHMVTSGYINRGIFLLGFVSEADKVALFKSSDIILIPSLFEGFGIPYIEAAYFKKILVSCDIPVCKEIMGDYPIYIRHPYQASDIELALSHAIIRLNSGQPNVEFELDRFRCETMSNRYLQIMKGFSCHV